MEENKDKEREEAPATEIRRRKFATSKNSDEALGTYPTLEELTEGYNLLTKGQDGYKVMTKEDIIKKGTALQQMRLYLCSANMGTYFDTKGRTLTQEEEASLIQSIREKVEVSYIKKCVSEYKILRKYGQHLRLYYKTVQVSFSFLAKLLSKWSSYEQIANQYTMAYRNATERLRASGCGEFAIKVAGNAIIDSASEARLDGAKLIFEDGFRRFKLKVDGKGGLYEKIEKEAKSVKKDLENFKAVALVAEEYIEASELKYMPIEIQMCIENAEEERYMRYLVKDTSFFRSDLNDRKARGELITPMDEKRAVIADYYEVKPNKTRYKDAKKGIKELQ